MSLSRNTLLLALIAFTAEPAFAAGRKCALSPTASKFVARLFKGGLASRFAHDHVIVAKDISGTFTIDHEQPAQSSLQLKVNARTLIADPDDTRKKYQMEPIPAEDKEKITESMQAEDQLFTAKYADISFVTKKIEPLKNDQIRIRGKFTLRGVTKNVTFTAKAKFAADKLQSSAQFIIRQSDFGYSPYSGGLGFVKVQDPVTFDIYLEATCPQTPPTAN